MLKILKRATSTILAVGLLCGSFPAALAEGEQHMSIICDTSKISATGLQLLPGGTSERIGAIKEKLAAYGLAEHTQMRAETKNRFDGKLEILVQTLCDFCQYDNPTHIIDDRVQYVVDHLSELSENMRKDLKTAYLNNLKTANRSGNVSYQGKVYPYFAFTQTDPEWGGVVYPYYKGDRRTIASSACGPTAMATILSNWFHREILPTELASYSAANGFRLSYGTSGRLFTSAANAYGAPTPFFAYTSKLNDIYKGIRDKGNMAIANVQYGHFTHGGHFIVLVAAKEINGSEYFLVADPNYPNNRYYNLGSDIIDEDPADPFVWAKKSIFPDECSELYWFKNDFRLSAPNYQMTVDEALTE